jgi:hypothetical protein
VLRFVVMTLEFLKSGRTCHGNSSIGIKPGVSWRLWVMNWKNSDIPTQTLPTQDSAPALKQILRKDVACSHLCVKCVCIVCAQWVGALLCEVSVAISVGVFEASMCVEVWGDNHVTPRGNNNVSLHVCVPACVCAHKCVAVCVHRHVCACWLWHSYVLVVCEQSVGACV